MFKYIKRSRGEQVTVLVTQCMKMLHRPGIEPGPPAWQASILPLNHRCCIISSFTSCKYYKSQSTVLVLSLLEPDGTTTALSVTFLP